MRLETASHVSSSSILSSEMSIASSRRISSSGRHIKDVTVDGEIGGKRWVEPVVKSQLCFAEYAIFDREELK